MFRLLPLFAILGCADKTDAGAGAPTSDAEATDDTAGPEAFADIIVVGAGISGLTVARALVEDGRSVVVLEARDRIGGRTWTTEIDGAPIDMGGAWIHGPRGNPIALFATANGLTFEADDMTLPHVHSAVDGPQDPAALDEMWDAIDGFIGAVESLREALGTTASAADGLALYLSWEGLAAPAERLAAYAIQELLVEVDYAGPMANTSLEWMWEDAAYRGGDHILDGGYIGVVEALARGVDVRTGSPVSAVSYGEDGVEVVTDGRVWTGDSVVITVPLGVLKAGRIAFDPPLPAEKLAAIDRLDMSSLEKVIFRFETKFWEGGALYISDEMGEFPYFADFTDPAGAPTLIGFYGGQFSRDTQDAMSDEAIAARVLGVLGEIMGTDVPEPLSTTVTRWRSDPYALGSYAYMPVGASPEDMRTLGEPVGDRVYFAGEATVWPFMGTTHAAMISGLREAERLGVASIRIPGLEDFDIPEW